MENLWRECGVLSLVCGTCVCVLVVSLSRKDVMTMGWSLSISSDLSC